MDIATPLISIIVPVYNTEKYIDRCLTSILNQTYKNLEIIIVDDGSSDKCREICDNYKKIDKRIKVIHKENGGVSSARNMGLNYAIGEWIYFCDSDDEIYHDGLESLISNIEEDTTLCFGGYSIENLNNRFISTGIAKTGRYEVINLLRWILNATPYYQGYLFNKLFKRTIIMNSNIRFDTNIHFNEDRLFIIKYLCSQSGKLYYIDKCIYRYYESNGAAMSSLQKGFNKKYLSDFDAFC